MLAPGGVFLFNVWDRIEENEFADTVTTALESVFPGDPPRFMARTPHGYHDHRAIERDLANGGFAASPRIDTVPARSRATSPRIPAIVFTQRINLSLQLSFCVILLWRNKLLINGT